MYLLFTVISMVIDTFLLTMNKGNVYPPSRNSRQAIDANSRFFQETFPFGEALPCQISFKDVERVQNLKEQCQDYDCEVGVG